VDRLTDIDVRGGVAGIQSRAAVERQSLDRPFGENDHAAFELHEIENVNERPDEPGGQTCNATSLGASPARRGMPSSQARCGGRASTVQCMPS
jgi:hypothetical protein